MIAPPHYKAECITLDKAGGISKLEKALEIIEYEIKKAEGTFKLVNKPQIIGAKDDKDIIEIMDKMNDDQESGEEGEEDNDEGMGDLNLSGGEFDSGDEQSKKTKKKRAAGDEEEEKGADEDSDS